MNTLEKDARILWDYLRLRQEPAPMDAVFALGSNATRVAERAADLFLKGYGRYLIVSGGNGPASQLARPEADVFADIARARGVPDEYIIVERVSTNTAENVTCVRALLRERGLALTSFLLVQKPYMERRVYATFRKQWPEAECLVTSPLLSFDDYARDRASTERLIRFMTDTLYRIKEYPALGFQIPQEVPHDVERAYEALLKIV